MKTCSSCKIEKIFEDFHRNKTRKDGFCNVCKECTKLRAKSHYENNKEHLSKLRQKYYLANQKKMRKQATVWRKQNVDKFRGYSAQYRMKKRAQTPELTKDEKQRIEDIYWLAKDLQAVTGEVYHVDHIRPVSKGGLHHPDNLQILPADLNFKKGCSYEEST